MHRTARPSAITDWCPDVTRLEADWDGCGAAPISRETVAKANALLVRIAADYAIYPHDIYPMNSGGMMVEWRRNDAILAIEVHDSAPYDCCLVEDVDTNRRAMRVRCVDQSEALRFVEKITNHHWRRPMSGEPRFPRIVCLCGSTRFWREFQRASLDETLAGRIVLSIGAATGTDDEHFGNLSSDKYARVKAMLDALHLRKIEMADEVLVVSDDSGYFGASTTREMHHAISLGKPVRWMHRAAEERWKAIRTDERSS